MPNIPNSSSPLDVPPAEKAKKLPGHKDVKTTMINTHALRVNRGGLAVKSPLDP